MTTSIRFEDGAAYERYMGVWSQQVGHAFLDWLAPAPALAWLDVGCGNGAFTETLVERASPTRVAGVDPSDAQLAYARSRPALRDADFRVGDAMALPFDDNVFDAAIMPLVIFFVPTPAVGVREMTRVVRPGGLVTAYAWDMDGEGFPYAMVQRAMRELEIAVPMPPNPSASNSDVLSALWTDAGLRDVRTTTITVSRSFTSFDEYWSIVLGGPSVGGTLRSLDSSHTARLQDRLRAILPADAHGGITYSARANAVVGRVPIV